MYFDNNSTSKIESYNSEQIAYPSSTSTQFTCRYMLLLMLVFLFFYYYSKFVYPRNRVVSLYLTFFYRVFYSVSETFQTTIQYENDNNKNNTSYYYVHTIVFIQNLHAHTHTTYKYVYNSYKNVFIKDILPIQKKNVIH